MALIGGNRVALYHGNRLALFGGNQVALYDGNSAEFSELMLLRQNALAGTQCLADILVEQIPEALKGHYRVTPLRGDQSKGYQSCIEAQCDSGAYDSLFDYAKTIDDQIEKRFALTREISEKLY
jgi:hypothetical protein